MKISRVIGRSFSIAPSTRRSISLDSRSLWPGPAPATILRRLSHACPIGGWPPPGPCHATGWWPFDLNRLRACQARASHPRPISPGGRRDHGRGQARPRGSRCGEPSNAKVSVTSLRYNASRHGGSWFSGRAGAPSVIGRGSPQSSERIALRDTSSGAPADRERCDCIIREIYLRHPSLLFRGGRQEAGC